MAQTETTKRRRGRQTSAVTSKQAGTHAGLVAAPNVDSDDLGQIRQSLENAAAMSRNIWLVFLTLASYLAITVGAVTHKDFFLETPARLPILNIDLPLLGFFVISPFLFLVFHLYLLLNLKLLADKAAGFNQVLERRSRNDQAIRPREDDVRLLLPNVIFLQLVGGPASSRQGWFSFLLRLIIWTTIAAGPILLFLVIEIKFLPYHDTLVTWWHRLLLTIDIILVWCFWPLIRLPAQKYYGSKLSIVWFCVAAAIIIFVVLIATFPGEIQDRNVLATAEWIPIHKSKKTVKSDWYQPQAENLFVPRRLYDLPGWHLTSLYSVLFLGNVNSVDGRRDSVWSNTLVLPDFKLSQGTKSREETLSLRGRNLHGAVLSRADLKGADLTGANLKQSRLVGAILANTKLGCAAVDEMPSLAPPGEVSEDWPDGCTWLDEAVLVQANLNGAVLKGVHLQGAILSQANLIGADLRSAQLQLAALDLAHLEGASLSGAQLQGADLELVRLTGAELQGANLDGALMIKSHFEGAVLDGASLVAATLSEAHLEGASMIGTNADLASFDRASLQGIEVAGNQSSFRGASFFDVRVWRAVGPYPHSVSNMRPDLITTPYEKEGYQVWLDRISSNLSSETKKRVEKRLGVLNPVDKEQDQNQSWANARKAFLEGPYPRRDLDWLIWSYVCGGEYPGREAAVILEGIKRNQLITVSLEEAVTDRAKCEAGRASKFR
jgi:uncharacterized protein YjbI with pentapeptide repeats